MPGGEACLLDSNILLRISKSDDPHHAAISYALHALVGLKRSSVPWTISFGFAILWLSTISIVDCQGMAIRHSSLGTLVGGSFGQRVLLRVIRWDGCACDRGLFSQP